MVRVCRLFVALAALIILVAGNLYGIRGEAKLRANSIYNVAGHAYGSSLAFIPALPGLLEVYPDDERHPTRSAAVLSERGVVLAPAHSSPHVDIVEQGGGRYSHWRGTLIFSSSDNSDPRSNGRTYRLKGRAKLTLVGNGVVVALAAMLWWAVPRVPVRRLVGGAVAALVPTRRGERRGGADLLRDPPLPRAWWHWACVAALFFAGIALNSAIFLPYFEEINSWDEVTYLTTGQALIDGGVMWPHSRGPLISFVYALLYLLTGWLDNWLLIISVAGRITGYGLIFLGAYKVGCELERRRLGHPLLITGMAVALPVYAPNLVNPGYTLFTGMAALAFWRLLVLVRRRQQSDLVKASIMIGLAALVRPEVALFAVMVIVGLATATSIRRVPRMLVALVVPYVLINGGYMYLHYAQTGVFQFGAGEKMYTTFEASQMLLFERNGMTDVQWIEAAQADARRTYGTPEENQYSVARAIAHNPTAFIHRVGINLQRTVPMIYTAYGVYWPFLTIPLTLLVVRGVIELVRRREWLMLATHVLWPAHLGVYFITISFPCYMVLPFFVIFSLACIGLCSGIANLGAWRERAGWAAGLVGVALTGLWLNEPWTLLVVALVVMALAVATLPALRTSRLGLAAAALVAVFLVANRPYAVRTQWPAPATGFELQAAELKRMLPKGSRVLAYPGNSVKLAKMEWVAPTPTMRSFKDKDAFRKYLSEAGVNAVLVDTYLTGHNPYDMADVVNANIGTTLERVWSTDDGRFQILVAKARS